MLPLRNKKSILSVALGLTTRMDQQEFRICKTRVTRRKSYISHQATIWNQITARKAQMLNKQKPKLVEKDAICSKDQTSCTTLRGPRKILVIKAPI